MAQNIVIGKKAGLLSVAFLKDNENFNKGKPPRRAVNITKEPH